MGDQDRTVLIRFFVGLAAIVIVVVLVWFIFVRDSGKKKDAQTGKTTTSQASKTTGTNTSTASKQADSAKSDQNTTAQNSQASTAGQLADTGPGDTAALFAAATVLAAVAHYTYRRRAYARAASRSGN
jgi:flagellar biosynthesis/type III secretory pathway M-ring protein FliF/YscJ